MNMKEKIFAGLFTGLTLMTAGTPLQVKHIGHSRLRPVGVRAGVSSTLGAMAVGYPELNVMLNNSINTAAGSPQEKEKKLHSEKLVREFKRQNALEKIRIEKEEEQRRIEEEQKRQAELQRKSYERDVLAAVMFREAGTNYDGDIAVGTCVMNRIADKHYPDTITGVIFQPNQFWSEADVQKFIQNGIPDICYKAADAVLSGVRSHEFTSYRADFTGQKGTNIGGNVFF